MLTNSYEEVFMVQKDIDCLLEASAEGRNKDFLEILSRSHKSILSKTDEDGNNVIHLAILNNHANIITSLASFLELHPDAKINLNSMNNIGESPLDMISSNAKNVQCNSCLIALENLSKVAKEPIYTSDSLRVLGAMQIEGFINSDFDIKKSNQVKSKKKDVEGIY